MRALSESRQRWTETLRNQSSGLAALQRAVQFKGPDSPCESGLRSVYWKTFLLFRDAPPQDQPLILGEARADYTALCDGYLQFVRHPERLTELAVDPLADDPDSPWDMFRRDEVVRNEILQDVRRLPDDPPLYHEAHIQTLILDVLFVYCRHHPETGGYRQGMHELLAPLVHVLAEDAVDYRTGAPAAEAEASADASAAASAAADAAADAAMAVMLDRQYLEHDAYALFSAIMSRAKSFYEVSNGNSLSNSTSISDGNSASSFLKEKTSSLFADGLFSGSLPLFHSSTTASTTEESTIVEMSKAIHEDTLMKIDPELAAHLKAIDILPQIFLIRWIRLLFGREFSFGQLLVLWDSLFALDPDLDLVPLICVAMLLRIRWQLLEADYSVALPLLLKYPPPQLPHEPYTFVYDALFLQDHLTTDGGAHLILKYTGRAPAKQPAPLALSSGTATSETSAGSAGNSNSASRPSTPNSPFAASLGSLRNRTRMAVRSPLQAALRASARSPGEPGEEGKIEGIGGVLGAAPTIVAAEEAIPGLASGGTSMPPSSMSPNPSLSPSRFAHGRENVEALFHGAAKGVMERGQKLGINQAVRDAVGEIRRNMLQGLQEARQAAKARTAAHHGSFGSSSSSGGLAYGRRTSNSGQVLQVLAEMERMEQRNQQLARMLDDTVTSLQSLVISASSQTKKAAQPDQDQQDRQDRQEAASSDTAARESTGMQQPPRWLDVVELAAAKVQFVKVHLEDVSLALELDDEHKQQEQPFAAAVAEAEAAETATESAVEDDLLDVATLAPALDADVEAAGGQREPTHTPADPPPVEPIASPPAPPTHPLPSRSTLAQSSFAWMLEPGDVPESSGSGSGSGSSSSSSNSKPSSLANPLASKRSPAGRGRHAFLFGEAVHASPLGDGSDDSSNKKNGKEEGSSGNSGNSSSSRSAASTGEVFGLETLRRTLPKD